MKPVYLELCGFGAYADKQIIDFRELEDTNIFVIAGPTGAGKTTIFDAIAYALFGTASGSTREGKSCRSDYADENTDTYVNLIFDIKGKEYKISRNPEYTRKKLKGEGLLKVKDKVELILPDGNVITKKNEVTEEIKNILGIDKDQFKQIVMLPQGEFKKMLESSSEEKEKIFRKIFNTEHFNDIQEKLIEKSKKIYVEIQKMLEERRAYVRNIEYGENYNLQGIIICEDVDVNLVVDKTNDFINEESQELNIVRDKQLLNKQKQAEVNKEKIKSEEINNILKEKIKIEEDKKGLEDKVQEIKAKEDILQKAEKANRVKVFDDACRDKKENLDREKAELNSIELNIKNLEAQLKQSEENLKSEEAKEQLREGVSSNIVELKGYLERIVGYESKQEKLKELNKQLKDISGEKEVEEKNLLLVNEAIEDLEKEVKAIQEAKVVIAGKREELSKLNQRKTDLESIIDKLSKTIELAKQHSIKGKEYIDKQAAWEKEKSLYEKMEEVFKREQAGLLAMSLKEGEPCPVCGSKEHPHLATTVQEVPSEEQIKKQKLKAENLDKEKNSIYNEVEKLNTEINSLKSQTEELKIKLISRECQEEFEKIFELESDAVRERLIIALGETKMLCDRVTKEGISLKNRITKEEDIIKSLEKNKKDRDEKSKLIEKLTENYVNVFGQYSSEEANIKTLENDIPEEIRSSKALNSKINSKEQELKLLKEALQKAKEQKEKLSVEHAAVVGSKKVKEDNIKLYTEQLETAKNALKDALSHDEFLDYREYKNSFKEKREMDSLNSDIRKFYEDLASVKKLYENACKKAEGLEVKDIESLELALIQLSKEELELKQIEIEFDKRISANKKAIANIEAINLKVKDKEEKYKVIAKVANMANGRNANKISFERYVLAAYFDDVIRAANVRLDKLSDGRFELSRSEEILDGRARKEGLEMNVYDYYTGKSRRVGTLSGGESFKASLALALGLSDAIQSYAGGIEIKTMFIDEGFGSLDDYSLENAIECLLDLQTGGRLVGIISHVQALKDRVGARIEVTKSSKGSSLKLTV
ncbi:AAA family ATPase [Inconstantimicrobium mannanitabidum]|uniref:Nuclease SbcCD subunit C n=1 Tax=Inconstantimicrobium mannanitabidum TaxID=1604901 RepID=A0ACB5RH41_9CLOT|nr:SMC family ATPase [Clostridium sp. TW13]GKX68415.1 nuclease SbcCD subunit C [Clostridium sp. TW13]